MSFFFYFVLDSSNHLACLLSLIGISVGIWITIWYERFNWFIFDCSTAHQLCKYNQRTDQKYDVKIKIYNI